MTSSGFSSEGERIRLYARGLKLNREGVVFNRALLPNQLIEAVRGYNAIPLGVRVDSMILSRCLPVNGHPKPRRLPVVTRAQHHVQVTRVETKDNLSSSRIQDCNLCVNDPIA